MLCVYTTAVKFHIRVNDFSSIHHNYKVLHELVRLLLCRFSSQGHTNDVKHTLHHSITSKSGMVSSLHDDYKKLNQIAITDLGVSPLTHNSNTGPVAKIAHFLALYNMYLVSRKCVSSCVFFSLDTFVPAQMIPDNIL